MRTLYPAIKPYVNHSLKVGTLHTLHVEECGNPDGIPVVFLHGGPGAGCSPVHRQFFDPEVYRVVLFDQRGCGHSTPHASLEANTTQDLIEDIEAIRIHLGIEKWVVFGGSWGSTLALLYAQSHSQQVLGLILRGIFLCRPEDIQWFYQQGASAVFPDHWGEFIRLIPNNERKDLLRAYHTRLIGEDEFTRMAAAKAWSAWEARCSTLNLSQNLVDHFSEPYQALSLARIETHFFVNNCFLEADQILRHMDRLEDIPATIVHGRYDMVCPVAQAWALHRVWPQAELQIIPGAGHSAFEPGILNALIKATEQMSAYLSEQSSDEPE
jgi:proline iminopeptidase